MVTFLARSSSVIFLLLFSLSYSNPIDQGEDATDVRHISKRCSGRWHPGRWSNWGLWSKCSSKCGFGLQSRSRVCHHVFPFDCCGSCWGSNREYSLCVEHSGCKAVTHKPVTHKPVQKPKTTKARRTKPTTNPVTVFKQTTKQKQKTTVPQFVWATININGRKFVWRGK